jgi:hypothetical protein
MYYESDKHKYRYFKDFPWANESKWILFLSFCMQLLYNLTFCQAAAGHWEPGKSPFWMLFTLAILVASPLLFPLWMWNLNLCGNIFIGLFRGIMEGVGEFVHCIKGDMMINNPDNEYFIKKLRRIELPGEPRIEPEVKLVEIEKVMDRTTGKILANKVVQQFTKEQIDNFDLYVTGKMP